ncbi:hypothetical protein ANO11243_001570 [Dothideomycetidae sp. 11243]|nr:hypothetical protein ANO11243_001570 [fungal sp. No.11243]
MFVSAPCIWQCIPFINAHRLPAVSSGRGPCKGRASFPTDLFLCTELILGSTFCFMADAGRLGLRKAEASSSDLGTALWNFLRLRDSAALRSVREARAISRILSDHTICARVFALLRVCTTIRISRTIPPAEERPAPALGLVAGSDLHRVGQMVLQLPGPALADQSAAIFIRVLEPGLPCC